THTPCLANRIHDAAWSQFTDLLSDKAAWAGRSYVAVNPAYTSQDCSQCGHRQTLSLSDRTATCPCCGIVLDRDYNASLNILRLGHQSWPAAKNPTAKAVGIFPLPSLTVPGRPPSGRQSKRKRPCPPPAPWSAQPRTARCWGSKCGRRRLCG